MWLQTVEVLHWWCERDTSHLSKTITELLDTRAVHRAVPNPNPSWGEKPQRTYQLHTKRPCPNQESSPGPLCCVMTVPTAVPHCCPLTHIHYLWRLAGDGGGARGGPVWHWATVGVHLLDLQYNMRLTCKNRQPFTFTQTGILLPSSNLLTVH